MTANAPTNSGYWTDSGNYATSFAGGTGIESDPYLISTPQQLAYLSVLINDSSTNSQYASLYYEQTANIDLSQYWWDAIGASTSTCRFKGYYDGGGNTISGIYTESNLAYQGLFGYVDGLSSKQAEIHDIGIINSYIQGTYSVGGIAGVAYRCKIYCCFNTSEVYGSNTSGYCGGIVGNLGSYTDTYDCYFSGKINTQGNGGGIAGDGGIGDIYDCFNSGDIIALKHAGGITAYKNNGIISNCYSTGDINGDYAGGICGLLSCDIIISYNIGKVEGSRYAAGIAGHSGLSNNVKNCYNLGEVIGNEAYSIGGIIGRSDSDSHKIMNCYNKGNISGSADYVGGIVGDSLVMGGEDVYNTIANCYNLGNINVSATYVGGILGAYHINIFNCYNIGRIEGSGECMGGVVGYYGEGVIGNCYFGGNCTLTEGIGAGSQVETERIDDINTTNYSKSEDWYLDTSNWYSEYPWDFTNTWSIVEGMNDGYPILMPTLEIMQFTITYHPNGASGSEVVESKVGSESYTIRSNMFTRSGYNFTGWNTEANGGGTSYSAGSSYSDLANLDLYAQWSRITYTIKYDKNASDATGSMANTTKYYGTNVTLRSNAFKRTGYSFAGWATEKGGNVVYSNGATYSANANVTLYAKWTAHKYTVKFNGNGSTSGSMSNQTFTYGTAQKLTSNAFKKTGFTFSKWTRNADGTGTSYTNGQSVKNLTSTNGATINLYAQWTARNEAKYDSAGKYWYVENGKIPQTKVTNSTLISNLNKATTNGSNYYIAGQTLTAKVYSGKEYCKWNNNWYEVEPIKWRLDASSSQKDGYGTTTDTNAVLAEIVYVDQYSSSSIDAGEGYSNQSVTDFMRNGISTTYLVNYATSTQTFGTGTSLYGTNASTTARMFVSSQSEIEAVNGNLNITFSDLVKDMIKYYGGTNSYFTRDLGSNYNNITCINAVGKEIQRFATDYRGLQFTVRFTEYGCVS